jgi:BlaI family penicillinase repressor
MEKNPKISESEWLVMNIIWKDHPITANRIMESIANINDWSRNTVKTFLARLVKKGAIGFENNGGEYNYYPLIEKAELRKEETRSFIDRVFDGAVRPVFTTLVESKKLSPEDIEELMRMLENEYRRKA